MFRLRRANKWLTYAITPFALCLLHLTLSKTASAQATLPQAFNPALRSDAAVGNIQGIQRYGRNLRTDPDRGEGFSYQIHPVLHAGPTVINAGGGGSDPSGTLSRAIQTQRLKRDELAAQSQSLSADDSKKDLKDQVDKQLKSLNEKILESYMQSYDAIQRSTRLSGAHALAQMQGYSPYHGYGPGFVTPCDATGGLRSAPLGAQLSADSPFQGLQSATQAVQQALAVGPRATGSTTAGSMNIYHQPLIQIKVRVVEIARNDSFQTSSVSDYISTSSQGTEASLITANNVNQNMRNLSGGSRFDQNGLITFPTQMTGQTLSSLTNSGALVNITSEHINYITRLLATELNADIVTAPQVVTLNGQNVDFVSGEKQPFQLGQNVVSGNSNNIQQFFYKHVGTFVSVTPGIVDWGFHGEGQGNASIQASEAADCNILAEWIVILHGKVIKHSLNEIVLAFEEHTIECGGSL